MNYTQPQPNVAPQQPQGYAQAAQTPPTQPNTATFIIDRKTQEIIGTVHPELVSALVNIAIKKYAGDPDFLDYFVMDQYKDYAQTVADQVQAHQSQTKEEPKVQTSGPVADFSSW